MGEQVAEVELVEDEMAQPMHEDAVQEPGEASRRRFAKAVSEKGA